MLEQVKEARRREQKAVKELEKAREALRETMRLAHDEGISIARVGVAAGVSRQRAAQMLRDE